MSMKITIDGAGRVVIPKRLRKAHGLAAGDTLELESTGEKITLRPVRDNAPLAREKGVWVFRTGQKLPASVADEVLADIRRQRDSDSLGRDAE